MSHTIKVKAGNKKRSGKDAAALANEKRQQRKAERTKREARKHTHE